MPNSMIPRESILYSIPTEMRRKDVFILEGIRYAAGTLGDIFANLEMAALDLSKKGKPEESNFYKIFKEAWSFIDFSWRLRNIMTLLDSEMDEEKIKGKRPVDISFLDPIREFRNTFQHLDERMIETMVKENSYIWGTLSWLYTKESSNVTCITIAPGHPRSKADVVNPTGQFIKLPISHITLQSINRKKEKIKINLTELHKNINLLLVDFEAIIKPQIEVMDNSKKFGQDLMIMMVFKSGLN
jgi:hypothetical protein